MYRRFTVALAALSLAGCNSADNKTDSEPVQTDPGLVVPETAAPAESIEDVTALESLPQAMQGRWGLVPADCTSTKGDNKGLLDIGPKTLKFYESLGTLGAITEASNQRIRATFSFTGEGMKWERDMALDLQDNGKVLVRTEYGAEAAPDPFRYSKCA